MWRGDLTPQRLLAAAEKLTEVVPDALLARNGVGNLAVVDGGLYVGYLDLFDGTLVLFGEENRGPALWPAVTP
jgi:hypothetical protein